MLRSRCFPEHCRTSPGNPPRPRATALTKALSCSSAFGQRVGIPARAIGGGIPPRDIYSNGQHELVLKAELPDMKEEAD
jgi:hypothetical protein